MKINERAIRPLVIKINNTLDTLNAMPECFLNWIHLQGFLINILKPGLTDFYFEYRPKCLDSILNIVRAINVTKVTHYWNRKYI